MPWAVRSQIANTWPTDFSVVLGNLDKAVAADPRNATAFLWRGIAWTRLGFFDRALADTGHAVELEPNYLNAIRHKALALLLAGKDEEAFALYDTGIDKGFTNSRTENFIAPMIARGRRIEGLLLMDVGHLAPELREALVRQLDAPSTPPLPLADLRALVARHASDPAVDQNQGTMTVTHLYLWLGDFDSAGKSDDSVTTTIVAWDRYPAGWRNSPGMKLKLRNQGVVDYWHAHGFPPQCRPVGANDFSCD
jgi:tetratricopeptide (TPR) repeat protein